MRLDSTPPIAETRPRTRPGSRRGGCAAAADRSGRDAPTEQGVVSGERLAERRPSASRARPIPGRLLDPRSLAPIATPSVPPTHRLIAHFKRPTTTRPPAPSEAGPSPGRPSFRHVSAERADVSFGRLHRHVECGGAKSNPYPGPSLFAAESHPNPILPAATLGARIKPMPIISCSDGLLSWLAAAAETPSRPGIASAGPNYAAQGGVARHQFHIGPARHRDHRPGTRSCVVQDVIRRVAEQTDRNHIPVKRRESRIA